MSGFYSNETFMNYLNISVKNYINLYNHLEFYEYYVKHSPNITNYFNFSIIEDEDFSTLKISYAFKYNFPQIVKKFLKLDNYRLDDVCHTNMKEKTAILTSNSILHKILKSKLECHYKFEPISDNSMKLITTYYYTCRLKIIGNTIENIFKNILKKEHKKNINIWNNYIKMKKDSK